MYEFEASGRRVFVDLKKVVAISAPKGDDTVVNIQLVGGFEYTIVAESEEAGRAAFKEILQRLQIQNR